MPPPKEIDLPNNEVFFELNATNVEPFIDEPYMPDSDQFKYNVRFYYRASDSPKEFWKNAMKYWDRDVDKFLGRETVSPKPSPPIPLPTTRPIKNLANSMPSSPRSITKTSFPPAPNRKSKRST